MYGIFLMNFKEDGLESKFRTDTVVSDRDSGRVVNRNFRQIYLQFPYFTKELDECSTLSDKLMYALKNMNNWNRVPDALKEQVFSHLDSLFTDIIFHNTAHVITVHRLIISDTVTLRQVSLGGKAVKMAEGAFGNCP